MRLCHVSPHLPPDQAANSLLPAQLGAWGAAAGHEVTFVTQDPAQGRTRARAASRPGPPRQHPTVLVVRSFDFCECDSWTRARAVTAALNDVAAGRDLVHLHSNGLIIEVASGWARPARHTDRAHAVRHGDLALPAPLAHRSIHARLHERDSGHVLQPADCSTARSRSA